MKVRFPPALKLRGTRTRFRPDEGLGEEAGRTFILRITLAISLKIARTAIYRHPVIARAPVFWAATLHFPHCLFIGCRKWGGAIPSSAVLGISGAERGEWPCWGDALCNDRASLAMLALLGMVWGNEELERSSKRMSGILVDRSSLGPEGAR